MNKRQRKKLTKKYMQSDYNALSKTATELYYYGDVSVKRDAEGERGRGLK